MKTAIVIGATGLIGNFVTRFLLEDHRYSKVKIFVRRSSGIVNSKLEEHIVDFDNIDSWSNNITGDELYSALGTTIKVAGSKEAQYKIDVTYQLKCAQAASKNGVKKFMLVSSAGANSSSNNFYLQIKGELEDKISSLNFDNVIIMQPSLLLGDRKENRFAERISQKLFPAIMFLPFLKEYRPIHASQVARAMIKTANCILDKKLNRFTLDKIFEYA